MTTSIDIYCKVTDYIEHNLTLRQLESWLVPMLPTFVSSPDSEVALIAGRIELGLAEINAGIISERSFRRQLKKSIDSPIKCQPYPAQTGGDDTTAASICDVISRDWASPSPSWSSVPQVANV